MSLVASSAVALEKQIKINNDGGSTHTVWVHKFCCYFEAISLIKREGERAKIMSFVGG